MPSTRLLPPASWRDHIAPTETDTVFRHRLLHGEVHDENAGRLGGVSGHAGLFSTAPDLARFARWLLETRAGVLPAGGRPEDNAPKLSSGLVRSFTARQNIPPASSRALGWATPFVNS